MKCFSAILILGMVLVSIDAFAAASGPAPATVSAPLSSTLTNPTSTVSPPSNTSAYVAGNLIASNATAGDIAVPSFTIATNNGGAAIGRVRLFVNDSATGWGSSLVQIDLWSAAPTFTNGDHGVFAVATGMSSHLGSYVVTLNNGGDGASGEGSVSPGNAATPVLTGSTVYWTAKFLSTSSNGIGGTHNLTLTAEVMN